MKRIFCVLSALIIVFSALTLSVSAEGTEYVYYVSVADGDDANSGEINTPFYTIERARTAVRELRESGIDDHVTIYLREGEYFRFRSFKLTEKDYNMTISAYGDENVSITGGKRLSDDMITSASDTEVGLRVKDATARGALKVADLSGIYHYIDIPDHDKDYGTIRLFTDGKPYTMSTYPDDRYNNAFKIEAIDETDTTAFTYIDDSNIASTWSDETISNMYVYGKLSACWYIEFDKIKAFDKENKKVTVDTPRAGYSVKESDFIFKNIAEEINAPGECYFDNADKKVYYYPYDEAENDLVLAICNDGLISGKGINNITFKNINFEYSRYSIFSITDKTETVDDTVVEVKPSENVTFDGCSFKHFTHSNLLHGNNNKITGCHFYNGSRGGLTFTGGDSAELTGGGNVIENSIFDDLANVRPSYAPAISVSGFNNTVKNNEIKNAEHLLMIVGGADTFIDGNRIHHGVQWTTDAGAVYYGRNPVAIGIEFKNNTFYDNYCPKAGYGSSSIYWDDRSLAPWIHDNVFYNSDKEMSFASNSSALKSNAGVYQTIENNTFVNIEPLYSGDYNFETNDVTGETFPERRKHIVFWLYANSKPTLIQNDASFQGWWDKILASGYFGKWQEHYKDSVWAHYLTIFTEESHKELTDLEEYNTNKYAKSIEVAEKYAPPYGVNKFINNVVYGADENSEAHVGAMNYSTNEGNNYADSPADLKDFDYAKYGISDEVWKNLMYDIITGTGESYSYELQSGGNRIVLEGAFAEPEETEKNVTVKIYSGDELVYFDQKMVMGDGFGFECISDEADNLRAVVVCDGEKVETE